MGILLTSMSPQLRGSKNPPHGPMSTEGHSPQMCCLFVGNPLLKEKQREYHPFWGPQTCFVCLWGTPFRLASKEKQWENHKPKLAGGGGGVQPIKTPIQQSWKQRMAFQSTKKIQGLQCATAIYVGCLRMRGSVGC